MSLKIQNKIDGLIIIIISLHVATLSIGYTMNYNSTAAANYAKNYCHKKILHLRIIMVLEVTVLILLANVYLPDLIDNSVGKRVFHIKNGIIGLIQDVKNQNIGKIEMAVCPMRQNSTIG